MVSFDVKPQLTIKPNNDVSGTVKVSTNKWGNTFSVTVSDDMVKDGLSTNGLRLGVKNDQGLELEYGEAAGRWVLALQPTIAQLRHRPLAARRCVQPPGPPDPALWHHH